LTIKTDTSGEQISILMCLDQHRATVAECLTPSYNYGLTQF